MKWNHRIIRFVEPDGEKLMFAEVYYNDSGKPTGYSEPFLLGDNIGDMRQLVNRLADCIDKPILNDTDFPNNERIEHDRNAQ